MDDKIINKLNALAKEKRLFNLKVFVVYRSEAPGGTIKVTSRSYVGWLRRIEDGFLILMKWENSVFIDYHIPMEDIAQLEILGKM